MGGPIPEKYRIKNLMDNFDMSQFVKVTVDRGSSCQIETKVKQTGSLLKYV